MRALRPDEADPDRAGAVLSQALRAMAGPPPPTAAAGPRVIAAYRLTANRLWLAATVFGVFLGVVAGLMRWVL